MAEIQVRLHSFKGSVALRIGEGETVYITPNTALRLSKELKLAGDQIGNGYHYPTTEIIGNK